MTLIEAPEGGPVILDVRSRPAEDPPPNSGREPSRPSSLSGTSILLVTTVLVTVLAVWMLLYAFVLSGLDEHGSQNRLYERFRLELSNATAPIGGQIKPGSPVALISAPSGGLHNVVVVEGTSSGYLASGPGHLSDTPLPGQAGSSVILGRSVTFGGPFARIAHMRAGAQVLVTTGQGTFTYRVTGVRHAGDPLPKPLNANQSGLTLVTSASSGWRSGWAPDHTVYVDAVLATGSVQPTPAGMPANVNRASLPMQDDPKGLVPLIFWFEALLVLSAAAVWSWYRWGRPQAWIVSVPALAFALWGTSGALMRFLPNLI